MREPMQLTIDDELQDRREPGARAVPMCELKALWDELRERNECWNGMTHYYLTERYGDRLYHVMGAGWYVREASS